MSTPSMTSSDSNAYFQTLSALTLTKSTIFNRQQASFVQHKEKIFFDNPDIDAGSEDAVKQIQKLIQAMSPPESKGERRFYVPATPDDIRQKLFADMLSGATSAVDPPWAILARLKILLSGGELDPEVFGSEELLGEWKETLLKAIETEEERMKIANIISKLLGEWATASRDTKRRSDQEEEEEDEEGYAKKMSKMEQLDTYTNLVFTPHPLDDDPDALKTKIHEYLNNIFQKTTEGSDFLTKVRRKLRSQGYAFPNAIRAADEGYIKRLVNTIAASSVFTNEKRSFLKDHILPNDTILSEFLDLMQLWSSDLGSWTWESAGLGSSGSGLGVKLQPRFHLNGKYRVYMDLDPTTAIFAHHVGRWFAKVLKESLETVFHPNVGAWVGAQGKPLEKKFAERLKSTLSPSGQVPSSVIDTLEYRRGIYQKGTFFLSNLSDQIDNKRDNYSTEAGIDDENNQDTSSGRRIKETILHTLMADFHLAKAFSNTKGGSKTFTVVVSDFKWFGPSLSHEMLATVLKYFGFSNDLVGFFRQYLNVPGYFDGQEEIPENIKRRVRGIPLDHPLSNMSAELLLFCLDYLVNQVSGGDVYLYRCFDDLWFWGEDQEKCELVWSHIEEFSATFGLELNQEKSGSMTFNFGESGEVTAAEVPSEYLPQGPVQWGFLTLTSEGRLAPNEDMVQGHITELTRQLSSAAHSSSILSFATAWNRYFAGFLPYHFAPPCYALGESHTTMVVSQLARIQTAVIENLNGGTKTTLVKYLRSEINRRFPDVDAANIPEAWFYWPHQFGGLGIRNPILKLGTQRIVKFNWRGQHDTKVVLEPGEIINKQVKQDKHLYRIAKERWLAAVEDRPRFFGVEPETFLSEEDFTSVEARTKFHSPWASIYQKLMSLPEEDEILGTPESVVLPGRVLGVASTVEPNGKAETMAENPYWRRVFGMYGPGVLRRWGGLQLVEKEWVPGGLLEEARSAKGGWDE